MTEAPEPPVDLPPLQRATLDDARLDELFSDIEQAAEHVEIVVKRHAEGYVGEETASLSLADARTLLAKRSVLGVQLRYRFRGAVWWDTLMVIPDGVELIRVEQRAP